ncbi:hypothetical protein MTR50_24860, partial [Escherichia coli]|nr:hypothetical protein [Escherichia coli]
MDNIEQLRKVATRAGKLLTSLSESIRQQKEELKLTEFYQEYSKAALYKLPKLSKGSVEYAVSEMEAGGYIFKKKPSGNTMKYAMTIQNVIDLYNCVFRSIRSRIGIEVRSAIRIHSINRELNFFYR